MSIFIIILIAGMIMIGIGITAIIINPDEFAFIRGMMLIITGMIVSALSYRFKTLSHR